MNSLLKLKELIKEKDITGKDLAEIVGVTPSTISNIVKGNHFPKPELLRSLAKALSIEVRDLFYSDNQDSKEQIYIKRDGVFVPIGEIDISSL